MSVSSKKKSSKNCYSKPEDISWILEGIVNYLRSPVWIAPIMNFMDENCSCFENREENRLEYTEIHHQYKMLVEKLIANYLKELGIAEKQFSDACNNNSSGLEKFEDLLKHVWAADDFLLFKRLMTARNLELEMQAISLTHEKSDAIQDWGDLPPYNPKFLPGQGKSCRTDDKSQLDEVMSQSKEEYMVLLQEMDALRQQEEADLLKALKISKEEMYRLSAEAMEEKRLLEEAIRLSLESFRNSRTEVRNMNQTVDKYDLPNLPSSSAATAAPVLSGNTPSRVSSAPDSKSSFGNSSSKKDRSAKSKSPSERSLPPLQQKVALSNEEAALDWIARAKEDSNIAEHTDANKSISKRDLLLSKKAGIDPSELAQRKAYLQSQRQKLLEAKKKKRNEELLQYQTGVTSESTGAGANLFGDSSQSQEEMEALNARRALAARLKKEVVKKNP